MNIDFHRPKNLGKSIEVQASNRPIKIAYIVPYGESSINHTIVDATFYESYTRWTGVYTLIIPSNSKRFLNSAYEKWLEFIDPDFVYSYLELEEDLIKKIETICSPIAFRLHTIRRNKTDGLDRRDYVPDWGHYFTPVSSISTVNSPNAQNSLSIRRERESEINVITKYGNVTGGKLFSDNFGTSFDISMVTHAIPGLFRTLCLVPPDLPKNVVVGSNKCFSISEVFSEIGKQAAIPIARFAMAHSDAIPKLQPYKWSHSFNIFIGKTLIDRIHFWNSRHFIPSHATSQGALIIEKEFFDDMDFVIQLGKYLNNNNFLGQNNGPATVRLKSYSLTEKELLLIKNKLNEHTYNSVLINKNFNEPAIPEPQDFKQSYFRGLTDTSTFKLAEDTNKIIAKEPDFFFYIPPRFRSITRGQWIVELIIQRHNNLSRFSNVVDNWTVPRRPKIVSAFTNNLGKITGDHRIAILPSSDNFPFESRSINKKCTYTLTLPDDETFFRYLTLGFFKYPEDDLRASIVEKKYESLSVSDKGQNLRGVISMFGNLSDAYSILTNIYWRQILRAGNENTTKYLMFDEKKMTSFLPNDRKTKDMLRVKLNLNNIGEVSNYLKCNLFDTLEHLVKVNIFHKTHQWRCGYCGYMNIRTFDSIKIKNHCEICGEEYFTPIDLEWTYQLNNFVFRSLVKHSGLPVLWTLGFLQESPFVGSFWYLPEVNLYGSNGVKDLNEIDILCVIGGKFFAVEVKQSAIHFIKSEREIENFIEEITRIKPDVAMLAFEQYCPTTKETETTKSALNHIAKDIKKRIGTNIDLKIVVAQDMDEFNEFPCDIGITGRRTHRWY